MLQHNNGILVAETGSGKTVMAINLISRINKPTLILVDKIKLLEQWKERLSSFINIYDDKQNKIDTGVLYSGKNTLNGIIDIASIKSLTNVEDIVDKYELVIVDEVHHIAATTFESIIRNLNARYTYGLTATPNRSDHLEKIIYKCTGPIVKEIGAQEKEFDKLLFPRFTSYKYPANNELISYVDLCNELCKDKKRNELIINDIVEQYHKGKNILVLTERIEHVQLLSNMLQQTCPNVFSIHSNVKTKEKKEFSLKLQNIDNGFIIVSTGKFLGEGFDLPKLNTLFLTMPFKWKGSLIQYIGRVQREYENKTVVEVYDYVDINVPQFSKQFEARLKQYKKENYLVKKEDKQIQFIFSYSEYKQYLIKEIQEAKQVMFLINKAIPSKVKKLLELNKNIVIYSNEDNIKEFNTNGLHSDINAIVIDSKVIWYGSINPFGYSGVNDSIMRIEDKMYAGMMVNKGWSDVY